MAEICRTALLQAMSTTRIWNDAIADEVLRKEDAVDHYEDVLGTYLVKLSAKHLSVDDNRTVNTLLHTIGDFERVSDHAVNIIKTAEEIRDKDIKFSEEALNELSHLAAQYSDVNCTPDDIRLYLDRIARGMPMAGKAAHMSNEELSDYLQSMREKKQGNVPVEE